MGAETNTLEDNWLNPEMLEWARNWRGLSIEHVASKFNKTPEHILSWEQNKSIPTVIQARKLADLYGRAFTEFFLPKPPDIPEPSALPDFRLHKDALDPFDEREVIQLQQWAISQRDSALDLYQEIGEPPLTIPQELFTTKMASPENAAAKARDIIGFSQEEQFLLKKGAAYTLPTIIRSRFESVGVLTLRHSELKKFGIRGLCIAEFPLPTVVFSSEAPTAQAFTLAHELAHILLKKGGITGPRSRDYDQSPEEKWCDHFAGAFLMPKTFIVEELGVRPAQALEIFSDAKLDNLAGKFRVSPHAMLVRLVQLGYVRAKYYWNTKKPEFDAQESDAKSFGRSKFYGTRYKSQLGDLYTGLVIEAWSSGRITNHNAAQYMGIKNIKHLNDIRHEYFEK